MVADGTGVGAGRLAGAQADAALSAGEFLHLVLVGHGVDGFMADGTPGLFPLRLVKDHHVAAVGTFPAGHFIRADIDGIAAGTVDFFAGKEAGLRLGVLPAAGTLNYKFRHFFPPVLHSTK